MESQPKYDALVNYFNNKKKVVIAFSGGVDSSFLVYAASQTLGDNAIAITLKSPYIPQWEVDESIEFANKYNIKHHVLELGILDSIKNNPPDRCYLCKKHLFKQIQQKAKDLGFDIVIDGSNADDTKDVRPGMKALHELGVESPLLELGFSKTDIRNISRQFRLPTWEKPAYACLMTRLPFNCDVTIEKLTQIEKAETFLIKRGLSGCRVRVHDDLARIEINPVYFDKLTDGYERDEIVEHFRTLGFNFVTLDLEGYKIGSFNSQLT